MNEKLTLLLQELEKLKHQAIALNKDVNMKIQASIDNNVQLFGLLDDLEKLEKQKILTIRLTYLIKDLERHELVLLDRWENANG